MTHPTFAIAVLFLAAALTEPARANLSRPTQGPHRLRVMLTQNARTQLHAGLLKGSQPVAAELQFDAPLDTSCILRLRVKPTEGRVIVSGRVPMNPQSAISEEERKLLSDSALGATGAIYQMSCRDFQPGTRVKIPLTLTSTSRPGRGSAFDVSLSVIGGKEDSVGINYATLVLSCDEQSVLKVDSSESIFAHQVEALRKDSRTKQAILISGSESTLPLDLGQVPETLSDDVSDLKRDQQ